MIKAYLRKRGDSSSLRAMKWFELHGLSFDYHPIGEITERDLRKVLELSDGFDDLLRSKEQSVYKNIKEAIDYSEVSTEKLVDFILRHPVVLRTPIIFDNNKLIIGYNEVEMRTFIPQSHRRVDYLERLYNIKSEVR